MGNNNIETIKTLASALNLDELKGSIALLESEYNRRKPQQSQKLVVYTHDCHHASNYHLRKYSHWCKLVTGIDETKANGFAFIGNFMPVTSEYMLPVGSIVVEVCGTTCTAYKLIGNYEKEIIAEQRRGSLYPLIQAVAAALKGKNNKVE